MTDHREGDRFWNAPKAQGELIAKLAIHVGSAERILQLRPKKAQNRLLLDWLPGTYQAHTVSFDH